MRFVRGFSMTPNTQVPLNNREPGTVAQVAWDQLKPYQIAAQSWPVYQEMRYDEAIERQRWVHACRVCEQGLWFNSDENQDPFDYSDAEILTLIVAHVRRSHADMVNDKGEFDYESTREHQVLDDSSKYRASGIGGDNAYRPHYQGRNPRPI